MSTNDTRGAGTSFEVACIACTHGWDNMRSFPTNDDRQAWVDGHQAESGHEEFRFQNLAGAASAAPETSPTSVVHETDWIEREAERLYRAEYAEAAQEWGDLEEWVRETWRVDARNIHKPRTYVQPVIDRLDELIPGNDPDLIRLYALLALSKGTSTNLEDVHDAWSLWRNTTNPAHRSLVPFDQLARDVQELDRKYMLAIHDAASAVSDG